MPRKPGPNEVEVTLTINRKAGTTRVEVRLGPGTDHAGLMKLIESELRPPSHTVMGACFSTGSYAMTRVPGNYPGMLNVLRAHKERLRVRLLTIRELDIPK